MKKAPTAGVKAIINSDLLAVFLTWAQAGRPNHLV